MKYVRPASMVLMGAISLIAIGGCTKGVKFDLARYNYAEPKTTELAKSTGEHWVKVREPGEKDYHEVDGTRRYVHAGDKVGFYTDPNGTIIAIADAYQRPLDVPAGSEVVWYTKFKRQTQFGREMQKLRSAKWIDVAQVIGVSAFAATVFILEVTSKDFEFDSADFK